MKLKINLQTVLEVPDDWEIIRSTDHHEVLKINDTLCDFTLTCTSNSATDPTEFWLTDDKLTKLIMAAIESFDFTIEEINDNSILPPLPLLDPESDAQR